MLRSSRRVISFVGDFVGECETSNGCLPTITWGLSRKYCVALCFGVILTYLCICRLLVASNPMTKIARITFGHTACSESHTAAFGHSAAKSELTGLRCGAASGEIMYPVSFRPRFFRGFDVARENIGYLFSK